jgi:hypothetical protein
MTGNDKVTECRECLTVKYEFALDARWHRRSHLEHSCVRVRKPGVSGRHVGDGTSSFRQGTRDDGCALTSEARTNAQILTRNIAGQQFSETCLGEPQTVRP